jgi:hypothetical protein
MVSNRGSVAPLYCLNRIVLSYSGGFSLCRLAIDGI